MLRGCILLALSATLAWAQSKFEIRGRIVDPDANRQPLAGVDVWIQAGEWSDSIDPNAARLTTNTGGEVSYSAPGAGLYVIHIKKDGYIGSSGTTVVLTEERPLGNFFLALQRSGEISGVVVDDETNQPLPNFDVGIASYGTHDGHVGVAQGWITRTDSEGRFRQRTYGGDYLAQVPARRIEENSRILTQYTEADIQAADIAYRSHLFPGGPTLETVLPIPLAIDRTATFGTIRIRKERLYRVLVNLDKASCPEGAALSGSNAMLRFGQLMGSRIQPILCGPFLLTHMDPGEYEIDLSAGEGASRVDVVARYTVTEQNLELPLRLSHGNTLRGTLKAGEGVDPPFIPKLKVIFRGVYSSLVGTDPNPHPVDEKGRFEYPNMQPRLRKIDVEGLDPAFYFVKEVRYRGTVAPGGLFYFTGEGELEIEIGYGTASLTGTVMNGDKPFESADVVLIRWPPVPEDATTVQHRPSIYGQILIRGIAPGEYRIFAIDPKDTALASQPAVWQRLLSRAEKVTLAPGASQNLVIQVSDPAR